MKQALQIPESLVSKHEVLKLQRELEGVQEALHQASLRSKDQKATLPATSSQLQEFAEINEANLMQADDNKMLLSFLVDLQKTAPVVHISFAADPSPQVLSKIVGWFRRESGLPVIIQIGLQPSIAAGCVIRTPNKYFDLSLRQHLIGEQPKLAQLIHEGGARG